MAADIRVISCAPEGIGVVELLEQMLERAREGEFSSVALAYVDRDGVTGSGWSKLHGTATMIGALEFTKASMIGAI